MIFRVLWTECLKLKRTLALWMVLASPMVVVVLYFLIGYFGTDSLAGGTTDVWQELVKNTVLLWTLLMMPLFVTLETSLLAGLEHSEKNWKSLLALPAPRWTVYMSKLVVMIAMLWAAHALLILGTLANGAVLSALRPALKLDAMPWSPLLVSIAKISASAMLGVTIQHWVSLRWQSFTAAMGFGMFVTVIGFMAANSNEWGPRFPWSMSLHTLRAGAAGWDLLMVSAGGAVLVAALGCWGFSRREIG